MEEVACALTGLHPNRLPWKVNETAEDYVHLKEVLTTLIADLVNAWVTLSKMEECV